MAGFEIFAPFFQCKTSVVHIIKSKTVQLYMTLYLILHL